MMHLIISDGQVNTRNLQMAGKDQRWLEAILLTHRRNLDEVFLLMVDDRGKVRMIAKEEKQS